MSKGPASTRRTAKTPRAVPRSSAPRRAPSDRRTVGERRASQVGRRSEGRRERAERRVVEDRRDVTSRASAARRPATARAAARPATRRASTATTRTTAKRATSAGTTARRTTPARATARRPSAAKRATPASRTAKRSAAKPATSRRTATAARSTAKRTTTRRAAPAKTAAKRTTARRPSAVKRAAPAKAAPKRAPAATRTTAKRTASARASAKRPTAAKRTATAARTTTRRTATAARTTAKRTTTGRATTRRATPAKAAAKRTTARRPSAAKRATPAKAAAKRAPAAARTTARRTAAKTAPKRAPARPAASRSATPRTAPKGAAAPRQKVSRPAPAAAATPARGAARPTRAHDERVLQAKLEEVARKAGVPSVVLERQRQEDPFAVLEWLVPRRSGIARGPVRAVTDAAEALLRHRIFVHPGAGGARVVPVVFGTGGHRGVIGSGLTLLHVHVIVTALLHAIAAMQPAQRAEVFGAARLADVQRRGFVLGHDNRLFNPDFSFYAASLLREAGYAVRYAGRISSPELSLLVPLQRWAGSLNFTPSHNPFRWGGLKFAPTDGGLAGGDLTDPLAAEANALLQRTAPADWPVPDALEDRIAAEAKRIERVDLHDVYLDALNGHPVVRLSALIEEIRALPADQRLVYVADPTWGAAVPVYQRLQKRLGADVLQVLHTEVDPYFGGQVTEPNEQTLADALRVLRRTPAAQKVMIRNDPDSDRGLVGDEGGAIQMNRFAPLVFRYLQEIGQQGELVTTLPTSQMGPDFARGQGSAVELTPTGFKNFRPYLKSGRALMAYEESNGLTIRGHTLDKDGILAGLLAVRMVLHYGRSLGELVREMESQVGRYYYRQETFAIDMSAAEAHRRLKRLGETRPGDSLQAGGRAHPIQAIDAQDGYRFALDEGAWVMVRPSGTEPKVRVYAETRESPQATASLCAAARELALAAVHGS